MLEREILTGAIDGHGFLFADGVLVQELIDRDPICGGHVGFSPDSTILKIRDIQARKIAGKSGIRSTKRNSKTEGAASLF